MAQIGNPIFKLELAIEEQLTIGGMKSADVIIANFGHDYNDVASYREALEDFRSFFTSRAQSLPLIIWRETTASHHGSEPGEAMTQVSTQVYISENNAPRSSWRRTPFTHSDLFYALWRSSGR